MYDLAKILRVGASQSLIITVFLMHADQHAHSTDADAGHDVQSATDPELSPSSDEDDFSPLPHVRRQLQESRTALSRAEARVIASTCAAAAAQEAKSALLRKLRVRETQLELLRHELRDLEFSVSRPEQQQGILQA